MQIIQMIRRLPFWAFVAITLTLIVSASGVATLSVTTTTTAAMVTAENFEADSDTVVENAEFLKAASGTAASGQTSGAAVESTTGFATVNQTLTQDNFTYQFELKEASNSAWGATRVYKVQAFSDGTLLDTLYLENSTNDDGNIEGVTAIFDLGNGDLPDAVTVKVSKVTD